MNSLIVFLSVVGVALAQWGHPAPVQETPEVAAARAAHLSALSSAGGHVPAPAAQSWNAGAPGVPADTPEVAAAKAAHFAALARAGSQSPQAPAQNSYDDGSYNPAWDSPSYNPAPAWNQQAAAPAWNQQAAAPAWNQQAAAPAWNQRAAAPAYGSSWQGPVALPPGYTASGAPLPVQDTPEVQAERAHHLALAARAGAPAPAYPQAAAAPAWNQGSWNQAAAPSWNQQAAPAWNQQAAAPAWNQQAAAPAGLPADTPEVAAAKAAHFAAHQAAAGHRYRRSLIAPLAYTAVAPVAIHPAPIAIHSAPIALHAPLVRHAVLLH